MNPASYRSILSLIVFLLAAVTIRAQEGAIVGRVLDEKTGLALPGANVFVANTTLGDATDENGSFRIAGMPPGRHNLVTSMVGYHPAFLTIAVDTELMPPVEIHLEEKVFETEAAEVTANRPKDWRRHLDRFTVELLGTSENADEATILNPYVLDFIEDKDTGTLRAFASEPLVIENRALGYEVIFVLQDFQVADAPYSIRYRGSPRFKERTSASQEESQSIAIRRRAAYLGSMRHFLISLTEGTLEEDGFDVRVGQRILTRPSEIDLLPEISADSLTTRGQASYETLVYAPGVLHVTYRQERESSRYRQFVEGITGAPTIRRSGQTSYVTFDRGVIVHTTGYTYDPYALTTHGYWTWERLADTLPRDYRPD